MKASEIKIGETYAIRKYPGRCFRVLESIAPPKNERRLQSFRVIDVDRTEPALWLEVAAAFERPLSVEQWRQETDKRNALAAARVAERNARDERLRVALARWRSLRSPDAPGPASEHFNNGLVSLRLEDFEALVAAAARAARLAGES